MSRRIVILLAVLLPADCSVSLAADKIGSPLRPYDRPQSGASAHRVGEAQRLDAINRQIGWNELFRWQAAMQTSSSIFFDPYIPGFDYADGLNRSAAGHGAWLPGTLDFRPIWGYGYYEAVRQPIGRSEVQTGPNRWETFPIYGDELLPAAAPVAPAASAVPRGREF